MGISIKQFLFCLLLFNSLKLWAAGCETKNLSNSPGFKDAQTISQIDLAWCYAFSLAHIISQKLGRAVSPIDIAIKANSFFKKQFDKGDFEGIPGRLTEDFVNSLSWVCPETNYTYPDEPFDHYQEEAKQLRKRASSNCHDHQFHSSFFKNLVNVDEVFKNIREQQITEPNEMMLKLNAENCTEKIPVDFKIEVESVSASNENKRAKLSNDLRSTIDDGKMVSFLFDVTPIFHLLQFQQMSFLENLKVHYSGNHFATIVGKEEEAGICYYKVRDSAFGNKCANTKESDQVTCLGDMIYRVPESLLLDTIKSTQIAK